MSKAIIFDLDGTLVDSCAICVSILQKMIDDRRVEHSIDAVAARPLMSRGGAEMVSALLGAAATRADEDLKEFRARYADEVTPKSALFPGVEAGLQELVARDFSLAICSNKPQNLCERVLSDTGIAEYFPVVVGGRTGIPPKPAPDLLNATLDGLRAPVSNCAFVGDSELDHHIANSAGMSFYFMTYGYADPAWEPSACHIVDDFTDLCERLQQDCFSNSAVP